MRHRVVVRAVEVAGLTVAGVELKKTQADIEIAVLCRAAYQIAPSRANTHLPIAPEQIPETSKQYPVW
jgi:hypothetical protein